ncbi:transposase [Streptomyces lydicamycinicus]|uniref:transposase n=1 Tax=Streptomyces lydicamycinicus TaxID=1546107 RepID=UPI003C2B3F28
MWLEAISWERLTDARADRIGKLTAADGGPWLRVAIDGAPTAHPEGLAARLADVLRIRGRSVQTVGTGGFLRPASLRYEFGPEDPDAYYDQWLDTGALWREVFNPLEADGSGRILPDLWDRPASRSDRSSAIQLASTSSATSSGCTQGASGKIRGLERRLTELMERHFPQLLTRVGIGPDSAATLLITMGDNPERLCSEASFAALCGVSPVEYSSGPQRHHRLNRGGERRANAALYRIVQTRLRFDARTRNYYERRTAEGKTRREIIRCLKRYAAREVFNLVRPGIGPHEAT